MKNCKYIFIVGIFVLLSSSARSQCNTNISICTAGTAGPFPFNVPGVPVSTCLDFIGPSVSYITLYITTGGPLEMLIDADSTTGFIDVAVFNIPSGIDPCVAIEDSTNEIGCNYASNSSGCNQFGNSFPCVSSVPAPIVSTGDKLMIVVENWSGVSSTFNLQLGNGAQTGPPNPTIDSIAPIVVSDPPIILAAIDAGGTWTASCGSCINDSTGEFHPSIAGVGTHDICYDIGAAPCDAQDCMSLEVGVNLGLEYTNVNISCTPNRKVDLKWETNQETNCSHFVVEKSHDALHFKLAGIVNGHGTTSEAISYLFEDQFDAQSTYYRLTEIDINGNEAIIGTYFIECSSPELNMYPNPASNEINLTYSNFMDNVTTISVFDDTGRVIHQEHGNTDGNSLIDISNLSPQVYIVKVNDAYHEKFDRFVKL